MQTETKTVTISNLEDLESHSLHLKRWTRYRRFQPTFIPRHWLQKAIDSTFPPFGGPKTKLLQLTSSWTGPSRNRRGSSPCKIIPPRTPFARKECGAEKPPKNSVVWKYADGYNVWFALRPCAIPLNNLAGSPYGRSPG